jgi:amino acid adenylation domain-containing protein
VNAVREQTDRTLAIGPQSVLAGEVAELVSEFTGMERVAFCNTGSEAVLAAVRMARTVTGKSKIAKFDGHYHGIFDEMQVRGAGQGSRLKTLPAAPGIPREAVQNTIILDYGDPDAFNVIREQADEIALVLVEPVRSRNPDFQPIEYVQALRRLTEELGIPLMFDEIVTGFRCHPQGAQHLFGIRADIATYGKVAGGGLPIGIVAGRAQYLDSLDGGMWEFGDDSQPTADMTWFAGTFVRHPMALAATRAVLRHLKDRGPALQEGLNAKAARLTAELNAFFASVSVPLRMERFASVLRLTFQARVEYADLLFFHLRNRGIMTYEGRPIFLSTAHTDADLDAVRDAFIDSVNTLIEVGLMPGTGPDGARVIGMAPGQQEIWVSSQFSADASCSYNLCSTIELRGPLDPAVMQAAIADLAARHEALRSVPDANGETQTIRARIDFPVRVSDLATLDPEGRDCARMAAERAEVTTPFDLVNGPLVRAHLLVLGPDHHKLLVTVHHVIADGYSCGVLVRELGKLYAARCDGTAPDLEPAQQLSEFVSFINQPDMMTARTEARDYWLDLYKDGLPRAELPSDHLRPTQRDYRAVRFVQAMAPGVAKRLREVAKAQDATLFAALVAGFSAYLSRLTGEEVTPLAFSAAGQPLMGGTALIGHCVNFLPLRLAPRLDMPFEAHVRATGGAVLDALEYQTFDFVSFVKEMKTERDVDWAPLVSIGINLDAAAKEIAFADFDVTADSVGRAFEHLDLFLNFVQTAEGAELQCTFNAARHDRATMERRMGEYLRFLGAAAAAPGTALGEVAFVAPADLAQQTALSGAATDYPRDAGIADLFRAAAAQNPAATAVVAPDGTRLSYADLDRRSDALAARLAAEGVGRGDMVALCLRPSADLMVAILASLKAGAAYVPVDPALPAARRDFILRDCAARIAIADPDAALPDEVTRLATEAPPPAGALPAAAGAEDVAYVMYTSGSTGTPKGVLVPNRAVVRLVRGTDYARFDASRVFLQLAPTGFDASTFEIWGALLNGGTLVIAAPALATDPAGLRRTIAAHGVTTLWLTAGLFNTLVDHDPGVLAGVEEILTGGEALSVPHVHRAQAALPETTFINGYGPTENTTFSCTHRIPRDLPEDLRSIPIGRPIANTRAYVVDRGLAPVPYGIAGELVVAGDGLALGYLGRPDLTEAAFVPAPALGEARVYRTGDYVRRLPDGTLDYLGRRDGQVKIRGFRIEPGEIEAALAAVPGVEQAAVIHTPHHGGVLTGFVAASHAQLTPTCLAEALRARLPRHMVPARLVILEALPVTGNGKLDRAALRARAEAALAAPEGTVRELSSVEVALTGIWRELLGTEAIRPDDSFFELGGHSLLAVELFARIERHFGTRMPISTLFGSPTLETLARRIEDAQSACSAGIDPEAEWDTSAVINPGPAGSAAPPLFIVGGVGGNLNNLVELARLVGRTRRVVGFQTRGVLGHSPRGTIEEMAAEHLRYLRRHQPDGPVHLAGFSGGAYIAFEMARQIEAAGGTVASLVLIDTMAPGAAREILYQGEGGFDPRTEGGRARIAATFRDVSLMGPRRILTRLLARGERALSRSPSQDDVGVVPACVSPVVEAWFVAARRYRGGAFGGRACLVLSGHEDERYRLLLDREPFAGWDRFIAKDRLERVQICASHRALVEMPHVTETARVVNEHLGRSA